MTAARAADADRRRLKKLGESREDPARYRPSCPRGQGASLVSIKDETQRPSSRDFATPAQTEIIRDARASSSDEDPDPREQTVVVTVSHADTSSRCRFQTYRRAAPETASAAGPCRRVTSEEVVTQIIRRLHAHAVLFFSREAMA